MRQKITALLLCVMAFAFNASAQDVWTNQNQFKALPFDMKEVRIKDGVYKKRFDVNYRYLKSFSVMPLLYNFRVNAGMKPKTHPLAGWEAPNVELRGHFTGHFLSALALEYSSTGDETFKLKADTLVRGLAEVQQKLGKSGYLSAFPESFFDRLESGKSVWAPYYTIHKILAGLLDCYTHLDNQQALDVAKKLGTWVYNRNKGFSHQQMQKILRTEYGGIGESLWILYDITGDTTYKEAALMFNDDSFLTPLYNHEDKLQGLHSNTQMAKLLAMTREYEETGDERDRELVSYAWHEITNARSYATGGNSNYEYFRSKPYELADLTGPDDHENCVTHNMLKITSHLFCWNPKVEYADYYENALLNGILGTQHPKVGGAIQYYVSQRPGSYRMFCKPDSAFVCCTGTGIESFAKLNDNIFFHNDSTLWVSQYIASTLNWKEKGLTLNVDTKYPRYDEIYFTFNTAEPKDLTVKFRIPYWASQGATISINGQLLETRGDAASWLTIRRVWKDGDKVELVIPRSMHLWHMPDNPHRVALLYGPVVMTQPLGNDDLKEGMQWGFGGLSDVENREGHVVDAPAIVTDDPLWYTKFHLHPGHHLTYDLSGVAQINDGTGSKPYDLSMGPFYDMCGKRYTIYFDVYTPQEWKDFNDKYRNFSNGIVDSIDFSDKVSLYDHNYQNYDGFRFDMRLPQQKSFKLRVTYYGNKSNQSFNMRIDGHSIGTKTLKPHEGTFTVDYDLPAELTLNKKRIAIGFSGKGIPRVRNAEIVAD